MGQAGPRDGARGEAGNLTFHEDHPIGGLSVRGVLSAPGSNASSAALKIIEGRGSSRKKEIKN